MTYDLKTIAKTFQISGEFLEGNPYGNGHINDTYAVVFNQGGTSVRYIFQRINHHIFHNPPALMDNVERVTTHVREKLQAEDAGDISRRVMTLIPTCDGQSYCQDADDNFWRVYVFIEGATTHDTLQHSYQAFEAASAFGEFQKMLVDIKGGPLHETIPDFHNGPKRFEAFCKALEEDAHNRAGSARDEVEFLQQNAGVFDVLSKLVEAGRIPVRTTHNDTKINNVMLDDKTGKGICVIDLDTIMPGLVLYDFGDMVRTSTSPADEDERDLTKVQMRMDRFDALVRGYLSTAGDFLNTAEIDHLVFAGKLITLIIGTRFLTDYLAGDVYFKVHRDGHNLDRCRTQFALVRSIMEQEEEMHALVQRVTNKD